VHNDAFKIGSLTIHWYGILVAVAFLAGLWTAARRGRREGFSAEQVYDLGPWLIIGGILGGRILYVISYWREAFAEKPFPEIFMIQHGGLVFYGGLIGSITACAIYLWLKKIPKWKMADVLAPSIALGYVFGRLGCFMNGCCYGRACSLRWAVSFPPHMENGKLVPHASGGVPVHPTQLYESLLNLAFYFFLAWLFRRKKFDGQVFAVYLLGYAVLRAFVEQFRGDYPVHYLGGWATPAQVISIATIIGGALLWYLLPRPQPKQG
jgi:phosphatidylglycerol---prolipoprotein diacylglyceryl transferase